MANNKSIDKEYLLNQLKAFDEKVLKKEYNFSKVKILELNEAFTEEELLSQLKANKGYECIGYWYNVNEDCYCEFIGFYNSKEISTDIVYFGFCHINGLHNSDYSVNYYVDDENNNVWYKKTLDDYINLDNYATKEDLAEIALVKIPNVTLFGNITNNHGQISGFSANDYAQLPFEFNVENKAFEFFVCFTPYTTASMPIINTEDETGGLIISSSTTGFVVNIFDKNNNQLVNAKITTTVVANKTYYIRVVWNRLQYTISHSEDGGKTYITDHTTPSGVPVGPCHLIFGKKGTLFLNGSINLNKCELYINRQPYWEGMDDVGMATRLDIDMSNISKNGEAKLETLLQDRFDEKADKVVGATNGNLANLTADGGISDAGMAVEDIVEIAEGKTATYIVNLSQNASFNSQDDSVTIDKITTVEGDEINVSDLKKGDIILVTDTNVPDRWFGGTNIFYKMETAKVDLTDYYTKSVTDGLLNYKVDKVEGKQLSTNDYTNEDKLALEQACEDVSDLQDETTELKENLIELEQKAITSTEEESYEPTVPRDADTLGGVAASEYALKDEIIDKMNVVIMDSFTSIDDFVRGVNTIAQNYDVSNPTMIRANISGHETIGIMIRWGVGFVVYILKEKNIYYSNYYSDTPHTITIV